MLTPLESQLLRALKVMVEVANNKCPDALAMFVAIEQAKGTIEIAEAKTSTAR